MYLPLCEHPQMSVSVYVLGCIFFNASKPNFTIISSVRQVRLGHVLTFDIIKLLESWERISNISWALPVRVYRRADNKHLMSL